MKKFDPRQRSAEARTRYTGRVNDDKLAWVRVVSGLWELIEMTEDESEQERIGPGYKIRFPKIGGRYEQYTLTTLTEPELIALRNFWECAFDLALPVVRERDRIARDAAEQGDDSYRRVYRQLPEAVTRPRAFELYDPTQRDVPEDEREEWIEKSGETQTSSPAESPLLEE